MKKTILMLSVLLFAVLMFSGCKSDEPKTDFDTGITSDSKSEAVEEEAPVDSAMAEIDEFFAQYVNTTERPIAVMVDNDDKNARPQAGLDEAYLIYEMTVEGGSTRFMALFRGADTAKIGPVRSSRHYFLDYSMENDAIYTHFGWSPKAMRDISAFGIDKINGILGEDGDTFWRERKYAGDWHSAFTSIEKIKAKASQKGIAAHTEHKNAIRYSESYLDSRSGTAANDVLLKYSSYQTGYRYNTQNGLYEKSINGEPHVMQNGNTLSFKNIIVMLISDTSLGDGSARRDLKTAGSGKGYYISDGICEEITWSKESRSTNTVYTRADGTELSINPGKTIINIISPSAGVVIG